MQVPQMRIASLIEKGLLPCEIRSSKKAPTLEERVPISIHLQNLSKKLNEDVVNEEHRNTLLPIVLENNEVFSRDELYIGCLKGC